MNLIKKIHKKYILILSIILPLLIIGGVFYANTLQDHTIPQEIKASIDEVGVFSESGENVEYPLELDESIKPEISAKVASVYDLQSEKYLYQKNKDDVRPIASLTKMMTALLIDKYGNYNDTFTVSQYAYSTENNAGNLSVGEELSILDLTNLSLIVSSNDASVTLSEYLVSKYASNPQFDVNDIQRSQEREILFTKLMNKEAAKMDLIHTMFQDPHGLNDTEAHSSIEDVNKLFLEILSRPALKKIMSTKELALSSADGSKTHVAINTNELLGTNGVIAGKTGFTYNAKQCLISLWEHESGKQFAILVLGSDDRFNDTSVLIDWLGNNFIWEETAEVVSD